MFASLNPDVEPLLDHLGEFGQVHRPLRRTGRGPPSQGRLRRPEDRYEGNGKYQLENWCDGYHPNFAHRSLFTEYIAGFAVTTAVPT